MPPSVIVLLSLVSQAAAQSPSTVTPWDGDVRVVVRGVADSEHRTVATGDEQHLAVDAGKVDATGHRDPASGRLVRWSAGGGASLVWTFQVTVFHDGTVARFDLVVPPADAPHLRFAMGAQTRWDSREAGTAFPESGRALVDSALTNGRSFVVQVAYMIPDNEQAGFHNLSLRYSASLDGAATPRSLPTIQPRARQPRGRAIPFPPARPLGPRNLPRSP